MGHAGSTMAMSRARALDGARYSEAFLEKLGHRPPMAFRAFLKRDKLRNDTKGA
jgi:hypothetical protein